MPAYWLKPEDRVNRAWFRPLEELAARIAGHPDLPLLNPAHFLYAARIERAGFPALHCYRHLGSRKYVNVDDAGQLWRYTSSDAVGYARYAPYERLADALEDLDLGRGNLLLGHLLSESVDDVPLPLMPPPTAAEQRAAQRMDQRRHDAGAASRVNRPGGGWATDEPTVPSGAAGGLEADEADENAGDEAGNEAGNEGATPGAEVAGAA